MLKLTATLLLISFPVPQRAVTPGQVWRGCGAIVGLDSLWGVIYRDNGNGAQVFARHPGLSFDFAGRFG